MTGKDSLFPDFSPPGAKVRALGQVWTPPQLVSFMCGLRANQGSLLEPASGNGAFLSVLERGAVGIEIDDDTIPDKRVRQLDFFAFPLGEQFDTIIGNPPYVRYRDIQNSTRRLLSSNLLE